MLLGGVQALLAPIFNLFALSLQRVMMMTSGSESPVDHGKSQGRRQTVLTDITVCTLHHDASSAKCALDPQEWYRLEKDLLLHSSTETTWLCIKHKSRAELSPSDQVIVDVQIGAQPSSRHQSLDEGWEARPFGLWIRRGLVSGAKQALTAVDVLFGTDAVDPRAGWHLLQDGLRLDQPSDVPEARLTLRYGPEVSHEPVPPELYLREDGTFKIAQISDTHMVTGPGICRDAIDGQVRLLPPSEADPLTVAFIEEVLDVEEPDLVVFTGDQLHHDIPDSQTALFKLTAPVIRRSIPWTLVFGNHDDEGALALSSMLTQKQSTYLRSKTPGNDKTTLSRKAANGRHRW
jgi:hypothetical protein